MFGKNKEKECIIVVLTANVNGTMKLLSLVINKYMKCQAFSCRYILNLDNLEMKWFANKKALMTISVFEEFMLDFKRKMVVA